MSSSYNRGRRIGNKAYTKETKSATEIVTLSPGDWKDDDTWIGTANTEVGLLGKE